MSKIVVIPFTEPKNIYYNGRLVTKAGSVVVSHGVNVDTMAVTILPSEPFHAFVHEHCTFYEGEWYLNEPERNTDDSI